MNLVQLSLAMRPDKRRLRSQDCCLNPTKNVKTRSCKKTKQKCRTISGENKGGEGTDTNKQEKKEKNTATVEVRDVDD